MVAIMSGAGLYGYHLISALFDKADMATKANLWGGAQALNIFLLVTLFGLFAGIATAVLGLRKIMNDIKFYTRNLGDGSMKVKSLAQRLSDSNMQLSANATETASSLEETVASLEELSSMISLNTDNSKKVYSVSESTKNIAESGEKNILSLTKAIEEIKGDSKKMEDIVNVIDDISFQTNLLALNAAVEAARAGEQGKGFAVVADAVRSLAQRSSTSAKEINLMIRESLSKVERGSQIAAECNKSLNQIFEQVKQVTELSGQIAQASQEQTSGLRQINQAMIQLDSASQHNAAAAENVLRASTDTQDQSSQVLEIIFSMEHFVFGHAQTRNSSSESKKAASKGVSPSVKINPVISQRELNKREVSKREVSKREVSKRESGRADAKLEVKREPTPKPELAAAGKFEMINSSTSSDAAKPGKVVSLSDKKPSVANLQLAKKPVLNMGVEPKDNRIKKVENF